MFRKPIHIVPLLAAILVAVLPCSASVNIPLDIKRDSADAEVICVGKVVPLEKCVTNATSPEITTQFRVDRVLKGDMAPDTLITLSYLRGQQHFSGYDLVLLNKGDASYVFSRTEGSMPASETADSVYERSADVVANLRWETNNSLQSSSRYVVCKALEQTALLSASDIAELVKPRLTDADIGIRAAATRACIAFGDNTQVLPAVELIEKLTIDAEGSERLAPVALMAELRKHKATPDLVEGLAAQLSSKSSAVREIVSYMLRESNLNSAISHLKIALSDSDPEVRYNAVMGLAKYTKDYGNAPAFPVYQADEQRYLDYWKHKTVD